MLLNIKKDKNDYKPASNLSVGYSAEGHNQSFSFVGNKIKVYHTTEEIALGTTYIVGEEGKFILESYKDFDEENFDGIFVY